MHEVCLSRVQRLFMRQELLPHLFAIILVGPAALQRFLIRHFIRKTSLRQALHKALLQSFSLCHTAPEFLPLCQPSRLRRMVARMEVVVIRFRRRCFLFLCLPCRLALLPLALERLWLSRQLSARQLCFLVVGQCAGRCSLRCAPGGRSFAPIRLCLKSILPVLQISQLLHLLRIALLSQPCCLQGLLDLLQALRKFLPAFHTELLPAFFVLGFRGCEQSRFGLSRKSCRLV